MTELKDKLGRVINVGDYFITALVHNSIAVLQFGKVLQLVHGDGRERHDGLREGTKVVSILCHNMTFNRGHVLRNKGGVSRLEYPERIVVIDALPDNVRELLDCFVWKGGGK